MDVRIDSERCQGHGRCYDLAPQVFSEDDEGYGLVTGDGTVSDEHANAVRLAVENCPENAIQVLQVAPR
jgi:ferredoxin